MRSRSRSLRATLEVSPRLRPGFNPETLESRRLLSAAPSDFEQYMLELINRARANPAAEAARLGIDLNEGLAPGTIPSTPVPPLAFNPDLIAAAQDYSATLLGAYNYFGHDYNSTTPQSRMAAAGYVFSGSYISDESLYAFYHETTQTVSAASTNSQYDGLFIDSDETGRGDRLNILNPNFTETGIGVMAGQTYQGVDMPPNHTNYHAVLTTVDFAASSADPNPFLTGAAFVDKLNTDFYAPGEGLGGLTITATQVGGSGVYTTTTFSTGGYSLAVPAGTYNVVASGAGLASPITQGDVVVADQNVEEDFIEPSKGVLTASFAAPLPAAPVLAGQKTNITATLLLGNMGNAMLSEKDTVNYDLSASGMVDSSAIALPGTQHAVLKLPVGKQSPLTYHLTSIPTTATPGNDYLVAQITEPSGAVTDVVTSNTLTIQPVQVRFSGSFVSATPTVKNGSSAVITISVTNNGNVATVGELPIQLSLSTLGPSDPSPIELSLVDHPLNLKVGKSVRFSLHIIISGEPDRSYFVLASLDPANTFKDDVMPDVQFGSATEVLTVTG